MAEKNPTRELGTERRFLVLPPALTAEQIRDAVAVIEDWEASRKSACELIVDLYPLLVRQDSHR